MKYYIILLYDGSLRILKHKQDKALLPRKARQFVSSSNVTVQDLYIWASDGYKGLKDLQEVMD